jgi:hypothetical protein
MSLIFIAIGIWLVYRAIKTKSQIKKDLAICLRTMGKVIDIESSWGQKSRIYSPKIAFQTNQNQMVVFVSPHGASINPYQTGQQVEVYYNPQNPNIAGIVGDSNEQISAVISIVVGIFFTAIGSFFAIFELMIYIGLILFKLNSK